MTGKRKEYTYLFTLFAVVLVLLMSSVSGAFLQKNNNYGNEPVTGPMTYTVTMKLGNQTNSDYEEVNNGKIMRIWPTEPFVKSPTVVKSNLNFKTSSSFFNCTDLGIYGTNYSIDRLQQKHDGITQVSRVGQFGQAPNNPPNVTLSPSIGYVDLGQSIKLNATINFKPPPSISYQWYEEAQGSSSFTPISGATSSSYTFTTTQSTTTGNWLFYVVVSWNGPPPGSPLTSNKAKVIVYNAPSISSQPSSATIDNGQSITLSSTVTGGTGTFSWQWYTGTPGSGSPIPSASGSGTTASYTASPSSTIEYYVVFTDTGTTSGVTPTETAQSTGATITVETASVSISPSSTQTIDNTQSITITSSISNGIGTPSYQWYESTTSGSSGFSKISGATSSSYTFTSSSTGNYWFNVTVIWTPSSPISGTSIATTTPVEIIVKALPTASINPSTAIIDSGQSVT
ncbi:MAG: hypothetical protein QXO75_11665, partial [Nitrososphaerota archaeon]